MWVKHLLRLMKRQTNIVQVYSVLYRYSLEYIEIKMGKSNSHRYITFNKLEVKPFKLTACA